MESTGIYWIPLYEMLKLNDIEPHLANARDVKGVKGRPKTDRADCIWLCRLHQYQLIRSSFVLSGKNQELKEYHSCALNLKKEKERYAKRINDTLIKMNLRLDIVVSDILGDSGRRIIESILSGQYSPEILYKLVDSRVKKTKKAFLEALDGFYSNERISILQLYYEEYIHLDDSILKINEQILKLLKTFPKKADIKNPPKMPENYREDVLRFSEPLRPILYEIYGCDLTQLPGIGASTVLTLLSVVGTDFNSFPSKNHFASWVGLAPNNQVSAGYCRSSRTKKVQNPLNNALKTAAMCASRTIDSYLGEKAKRFRRRMLPIESKCAIARNLACIIYDCITRNISVEKFDSIKFLEDNRKKEIEKLRYKAQKYGFNLAPTM